MPSNNKRPRGKMPRCINGGTEAKMLTLRLPPGLYSKVAQVSLANNQSLNGYVTSVIERAILLIESKQDDEETNLYTAVSDARRPPGIEGASTNEG